MGAENLEKILAALVLFFFLVVGPAAGEGRATTWAIKPYRALLIVDRWSDPTSMLVDHEKDDFQPVAALLKAWSVPFDILRLDQQHLDKYLKMATALRAAGINTEVYLEAAKIDKQLQYASRKEFRVALIAGESEFAKNVVQIKDLSARESREVPIDDVVSPIKELLRR